MRGRPGRAAIPVLVMGFALMVLSAGVAVAGPLGSGGTNDAQGQSAPVDHLHGADKGRGQDDGQSTGGQGAQGGQGGQGAQGAGWGDHRDHDHDRGNWGSGGSAGSGGGGVSGSSAGGGTGTPPVTTPAVPTPTVPAVAPALPVTPPVVAVAAAPLPSPVAAPTAGSTAAPTAASAAGDTTADVAAAAPDLSGLAGLTPPVAPTPAASQAGLLPAARGVLATPEARSLAAVLALALAVLLFLAVQGRFDRGEPKLAGVRDGRDVARFR